MSQRCGYKLMGKSAVTLYRNSSSSKLLSQNCRNISTSTNMFNKNEDEKQKDSESNEGNKPTKGFYARVKEEFLQDFKSKEENKETLEALQKHSEKFRSQYDKHIGSKLQSFRSKTEETNSENMSKETFSFRDKIDPIKSKLNKESLIEEYNRIIQNSKEKSESSINRLKSWQEKRKENVEQSKVNEEPTVEKKSSVLKQQFSKMLEQSGMLNNPYYKKAVEQTKENKETLYGYSAAATEALKKSSEALKKSSDDAFSKIGKKVDKTQEEFEKSGLREAFQDKGKEALTEGERIARETAEIARETGERIAKEKEELQKSETFKKVTEAAQETVRTTVEDFYSPTKLKQSEAYKSPEQLKKRIEEEKEEDTEPKEDPRKIKIDEETVGITEHKGWKWDTSWKNFKEQNPVVQKLMQFRENLEESDSIFARAGYRVFDTVSGVVTGTLQPSEISNTISEIQKMDPHFNITTFAVTLQFDIVPNVIEAYLRNDVAILENWCHERAMGQFKHMLAARDFKGTIRLFDIAECEILTGVMIDDLGPVFMFNVRTQQLFTEVVRSKSEDGEVTEDEEETIKVIQYTIAVCRDQTMMDPTAAWAVLEVIEHVIAEDYGGAWFGKKKGSEKK